MFANFYFKRALRILPSFLVVLGLYFALPGFRDKIDLEPAWRYLMFIANFGDLMTKGFSHIWSLCVEEHFYLVFPIVVALGYRRLSRSAITLSVLTLVVFGVILRYWLWKNQVGNQFELGSAKKMLFINRIYYPTYCRLDGLIVGVSLAMIREFNPEIWSRLTNFPRSIFGVGILLVVCGAAIMPGVNPSVAAAMGAFPLVSLGFGALTVADPSIYPRRTRI